MGKLRLSDFGKCVSPIPTPGLHERFSCVLQMGEHLKMFLLDQGFAAQILQVSLVWGAAIYEMLTLGKTSEQLQTSHSITKFLVLLINSRANLTVIYLPKYFLPKMEAFVFKTHSGKKWPQLLSQLLYFAQGFLNVYGYISW